MGVLDKYRTEIKNGTKITYSESDLNKLERTYELELFDRRDKTIFSPFRKEQQRCFQTQVRDYAFEQILDRQLYTFKHILVIPDPYGVSPQVALLLFNSSEKRKVRYCVHGISEEDDFWGETPFACRHRVPVLGLLQKRNNDVDLWLLDEDERVIKHRVLRIFVPEVNLLIEEKTGVDDKEVSHMPLILLNGMGIRPMVFDGNGKLRYRLWLGAAHVNILPLENGNFLAVDSGANTMNEYGEILPCRYHEMDYMGRVYRSFLLEYKIGSAVASCGDSLFLVTDSDAAHKNDRIAELDMNSGEISSRCDLRELLGDKYYKEGDWAAVRSLRYHDGMLLITLKRLHTVLLLEWESKKILWMLAPQVIWQDTALNLFCLTVADYQGSVLTRPDSAVFVGDRHKTGMEIAVFDTGFQGDIKTGEKTPKCSAVRRFRIDMAAMCYEVVGETRLEKTLAFGDVIVQEAGKKLLAVQGKLKNAAKNRLAYLGEVDFHKKQSAPHISFPRKITRAWTFEPRLDDYCKPVSSQGDVLFGSILPPQVFRGELPPVSKEKIDRSYFSRIMICDDLVLFSMVPGVVDRVYFMGEHHSYVQDYRGIQERDKKVRFAVSLKEFANDEYYMYIEMHDGLYRLKNEIRVEK